MQSDLPANLQIQVLVCFIASRCCKYNWLVFGLPLPLAIFIFWLFLSFSTLFFIHILNAGVFKRQSEDETFFGRTTVSYSGTSEHRQL